MISLKGNKAYILIVLSLLAIAAIFIIDPLSLISLIWILSLTLIFHKIFFKNDSFYTILVLFFSFTILTAIIYWLQYLQFPVNKGCTGANIFGGTDDLFFYQETKTNGFSYRGDRSLSMHHYSIFLRFFSNVINLYKEVKLYDLLLINVMAFSFIPIFTKKVSEQLNLSEKSIKLSFLFTAICPLLIINGLVLIRDGWTAMLLIASIYFLIQRRLLWLILAFLLAFYLRVSSGMIIIFFVLALLFFSNSLDLTKYSSGKKFFYIFIISIVILLSIPAFLIFIKLTGLDKDIFFRDSFLSSAELSHDNNSTAKLIYSLNPLIRMPASFLFYLGSPFLSIKHLWYNGFITPRMFIEFLFPFLFIIYFKNFIQFIPSYLFSKNYRLVNILFYCFIISVFVLSQLSLQIRHKTMLMPVFYIIVAAGFECKIISNRFIASLASIGLFGLQIIYIILPYII